jgi:hypothetical protein
MRRIRGDAVDLFPVSYTPSSLRGLARSRGLTAHNRRWAYLLAVLLIGVITTLQAQAPPALADTSSGPAISAVNGWSLYGLAPLDLDAQLAQMEADGVSVLRIDASWSSIQLAAPGPGGPTYSFSGEDAEVAALAVHHIQWLPVIDYSAPWAGTIVGDWRSPPADDAQFAAFAAAIAARYGAGGTFWSQNPQLPYEPVSTFEIWNEENGDYFWDTGPDPAGYARLYLAARAAIHAVDGGAQVMIGGLTNPEQGISALAYLTQMFQDVPALAGNVDAVGLHPYAADATGVVSIVVGVRDLLDSLGESSVPIDVTEFGWQTGDPAVEQQRAAMMSEVALALGNSNCGIGLLAPYDWMDPSYITDGDWGLAGTSGVRPAGTAWFSGLSAAAASPETVLCPTVTPSPGNGSSIPPGNGGSTTSTTTTTGPPTTTDPLTTTSAPTVAPAPSTRTSVTHRASKVAVSKAKPRARKRRRASGRRKATKRRPIRAKHRLPVHRDS